MSRFVVLWNITIYNAFSVERLLVWRKHVCRLCIWCSTHRFYSWEPQESFTGSEHLVDAFWARAARGLDGRDKNDLTSFQVGDQFLPIGPPRMRLLPYLQVAYTDEHQLGQKKSKNLA